MQLSPNPAEKPIKIRDNPLHRTCPYYLGSSSVSAVIHGDRANTNTCNHYIDGLALQRFQRDFATVDKNQRESKRYQKEANYEKRRNLCIQRENGFKIREEENLKKMRDRQYQSQMLHNIGAKVTAHTESIAVNPINLHYEPNYRGYYQQNLDEENKINKLVRAHNLQVQGTSGYNIITGKNSLHVGSLVPPEAQEAFDRKLQKFYAKYRIGPGQAQSVHQNAN